MPLSLQDKKMIVTKVRKLSEKALSAVVADFCGVSANAMTKLREVGRKVDVRICIVRNTLLRRAIENSVFMCLKDTFVGQTLIAYSMKHPGAAARLFKEFTRENTTFKIKAAAFKEEFISASQLDRLATLPTYEEAISHLILIIRDASIGKLMRTLTAIYKKRSF